MPAPAPERRDVWLLCRRAREQSRWCARQVVNTRSRAASTARANGKKRAARHLTRRDVAQAWQAIRLRVRWCAALLSAARSNLQAHAASQHAAGRRALTSVPRFYVQAKRAVLTTAGFGAPALRLVHPQSSASSRLRSHVLLQAFSWPSTALLCSSWSACAAANAAWCVPQPRCDAAKAQQERSSTLRLPSLGQLSGGWLRHRRAARVAHPARAGGSAQQRHQRGADAGR